MINGVQKLYETYPNPPEPIPARPPSGYNGCGNWQSLDRSATRKPPQKSNIGILEAAGDRTVVGQYLGDRQQPRFIKPVPKKSAIVIVNQAVKIIN